jgi:hypothetical protein
MSAINHNFANLPSWEQLENYRTLTAILLNNPHGLSTEELEAFKSVLFSLNPGSLTLDEVTIVERVFPDDWKGYCSFHFCEEQEKGVDS